MFEAIVYFCYEYADHLKTHLDGTASTGIYPIITCQHIEAEWRGHHWFRKWLLSKPLRGYYQLDTWEQISVTFKSKIELFFIQESALEKSSAKSRPFCLGHNVLTKMVLDQTAFHNDAHHRSCLNQIPSAFKYCNKIWFRTLVLRGCVVKITFSTRIYAC